MTRYAMILRNNNAQLELEQKPYNSTLEELHEACNCSTIAVYSALAYLNETLPAIDGWHDLLFACDDDGKLMNKPAVLPVVKGDKIVDWLVGDIAFIKRSPNPNGADDIGLSISECMELIEALNNIHIPEEI